MIQAIVGGIGALAGGLIGAKATKDAARTQAEGTAQSLAEQKRQYDISRADIKEGQSLASQNLMQYNQLAQGQYRSIPQLYQNINDPSFRQQGTLAGQQQGSLQSMYSAAYPEMMRMSQGGYTQGIGTLQGMQPQIQQQLSSGFQGAEQALGGANYNLDPILQSAAAARQQGMTGATGTLTPYTTTGASALEGYSRAAMDPYSSPLFTKKLQRGQESLNEQLAAQGLLGSGAQLELSRDLYENLSAQEQAASEQRMLNLAQMGYGSGQQLAGMYGQMGMDQAGQIGQLGLAEQQLQGSTASQLATLRAQQGQLGAGYTADLAGQLANMQVGQGAAGTAIRESQLANEAQNLQNYYNQLAKIEEAKRISSVGAAEQSTTGLANLYSQMGSGLANIQQGASVPLANLSQQYGASTANLLTSGAENQAAAKLAQASGVGSTLTDLAKIYGQYESQKKQDELIKNLGSGDTADLYRLMLLQRG